MFTFVEVVGFGKQASERKEKNLRSVQKVKNGSNEIRKNWYNLLPNEWTAEV